MTFLNLDFMKHEYNYTKEGCSLYPQSQHYENISEANNSVLASTSNRLDETGELRLNAQMDYAVMKLYAERVLRKNLQAQAEKLQQTNVNLTIEKTAAIYERDTMTKKYSELIAIIPWHNYNNCNRSAEVPQFRCLAEESPEKESQKHYSDDFRPHSGRLCSFLITLARFTFRIECLSAESHIREDTHKI